MTVGAIAGMLMTVPAGAWVDATAHKRALVAAAGICSVLASGLILVSQSFWPVAVSQVATAIAGAAIGPAVVGITLGMVGQAGFNRQVGINQAYNHAGNAVGAALSGLLGWRFGLPAVFWLAVVFGVASIAAVAMIPGRMIDDAAARGSPEGVAGGGKVSGLDVLLTCRPLLILAAALASAGQGDPAAIVGATIVIAQTTMIAAALSPAVGGWLAQKSDYNTAFLVLGGLAVGSLVIWIAGRPMMVTVRREGE